MSNGQLAFDVVASYENHLEKPQTLTQTADVLLALSFEVAANI